MNRRALLIVGLFISSWLTGASQTASKAASPFDDKFLSEIDTSDAVVIRAYQDSLFTIGGEDFELSELCGLVRKSHRFKVVVQFKREVAFQTYLDFYQELNACLGDENDKEIIEVRPPE